MLPPLARGDPYVALARAFLSRIGYAANGWNLGVNIGPTKRLLDGAADRLVALSDRQGPVSIVGFSMGGLFARWSALRMPNRARQVITVCSPIHEPARNFWLPVGPFLRLWRGDDLRMLADEVARPLPAPCTVLFSRKNGLVNLVSLRGRVLSGGLHRNHRGARVDRVQRLGDEDCGRAVGARRAVKGLGSQRGVLPAGSWLGAVIVEVNFTVGL